MARFAIFTPWRTLLLLSLIFLTSGCSSKRVPVYPVSGKVLVDEQPVEDLQVFFHPLEESEDRLAPSALTNDKGEFELGTQERLGAPAGKYAVTFTWREKSGLLKNQMDGPDRLQGRYADPKKTKFIITIDQQATQLEPFHLTKK